MGSWPHRFLALITILMLAPAAGGEVIAGESDFHLTLQSKWMYGPVSGHVQSPRGGSAGSTSANRPSLGEIGINTASIYDGEIRPGFGDHEIYIGGQVVRLSDDARLEEDLLSHGELFAAGSAVESDVKLDWYRLGYRYRIQKGDEKDVDLPVDIYSRFGVALLDFGYELSGAGGAGVEREYMKAAAQMGVDVEWRATKRFSVCGEVSWTVPIRSPLILTASVTGTCNFVGKDGRGVAGFVGAGYEKISYHDHGDVRNEINADFGPMLVLGLELRL